jgi:hypothetical protein
MTISLGVILIFTPFVGLTEMREADRLKIEKTLKEYQELDISYFSSMGEPDRAIVAREHKAMTDGLKRLRDEIANA